MPASRLHRVLGALVFVLTFTGCAALFPNEGLPPGSRRIVITIDNRSSDRPAVVQVAGAGERPGPAVGRAAPNPVPPSSAADVAFDVPPGHLWMIWVNQQAIVAAGDVPVGATGKTPITIDVAADGTVSAGTSANQPGWFGD